MGQVFDAGKDVSAGYRSSGDIFEFVRTTLVTAFRFRPMAMRAGAPSAESHRKPPIKKFESGYPIELRG